MARKMEKEGTVKSLVFLGILLVMFFAISSYGPGAQAEASDSNGWNNSILAFSTIALAVFTCALVVATTYYAIQTKRSVALNEDLLETNRELIELNKAANDLTKAGLLLKLLIEYDDKLYSPKPEDGALDQVIRAYLRKTAVEVLGEDFRRKVRLKLKASQPATYIFSLTLEPGQEGTVSVLEWEIYKETQRHVVDRFEVIEYIEPEDH
jgi:hypothetical protein